MRKKAYWKKLCSIGFVFTFMMSTIGAASLHPKEETFVVSFLGDSITYGAHADESYADILAKKWGATEYYNYGICKTEISTSGVRSDPMVERYTQISKDSNLIFVLGGTNDWGHNAILGTYGDTDPSTFYGALETMMQGLKEEYPNAQIIFATPIKRISTGSASAKNKNGNTLEQFAQAVIEVGEEQQVTVIDLYHAKECDFTSDTTYEIYWTDGLHPNDEGHQRIANYLYQTIMLNM